ncbi:hypothetical protein BMS3Abin11_01502 [bacterium BMS3Abin11]|nr:hypothetical protein BMS3Abin11_01502 [bacterium BMS3Abin11]
MQLPFLLLMFGVDLKNPVQACREAEIEPEKRDVLSERQRVSHPAGSIEHRREPEGQACGCSFFWLLFFEQAK